VGQGQRDEVAIRLADHFRKQGMSQELTTATLLAWNQKNDPPMAMQEIETKVTSAWMNDVDYGCHDHILASHCSNTCFLYSKLIKNQNEEELSALECNLKTREDLVRAYVDRFFEGKGISLGIPTLDANLKLHGGHVLQYMAKSGSGKTSFAMHVMNNMSKQNIPTLFLSLEMSDADVAERGFQMASNTTSAVLERMMVQFLNEGISREEMTDTIISKMGNAFSSVITADEDSASIDSIEQYIYKAKEAFGIKVVFVDYLGRVSQTKATSYEHISELAKGLKSMAKRHDIVIFYLHQVNRSIEDASAAVDMSAGRDSGQTEEAADVVLGSWRPGAAEGMKEFVVRILKNRRGASNIDAYLEFEPETMQFRELTDGYESRL
jgi:replicative DNA helicase